MTQTEKILTYMLRMLKSKEWFYPPDFMQPEMDFEDPYFVGYEASARLSDLARQYPDLIESRRRGKYTERRIRLENIHKEAIRIGGEVGSLLSRQIALSQIPKPDPQQLV